MSEAYIQKLRHAELPLHAQPPHVLTALNDIQRRNLSFFEQRETEAQIGGFLFDDMGLGKTLSILAYLTLYPQHRTLIVVPTNVLHGWENEVKKHLEPGFLSLGFYYGKERNKPGSVLTQNILLTTYATVAHEYNPETDSFHSHSLLHTQVFDRVVLDEAHAIRTRSSKQAKAVMCLMAKLRWCLTGTPIWNELADLYSLIAFIRLYPLADFGFFKRTVIDKVARQPRETFDYVCDFLVGVAIRHDKSVVLTGLKRIDRRLQLDLNARDAQLYSRLRSLAHRKVTYLLAMYDHLQDLAAPADIVSRVRFCTVSVLTQLRQAATCIDIVFNGLSPDDYFRRCLGETSCCVCFNDQVSVTLHPCLHHLCVSCKDLLPCACPVPGCKSVPTSVVPATPEITLSGSVTYGALSTKTELVLDLLAKNPGQKFIIYTVWLRYLDTLAHWLTQRRINFRRIEGSVSAARRTAIEQEFTTNPEVTVLICSLTAASVGLNLQISNQVILVDVYWNEACPSQASSRVERLGQTADTVTIYQLVARRTIDEAIVDMMDKKHQVALTTMTGTTSRTNTMNWANNIRLLMNTIFT
jgi:SNF2 family DNA or RNA helicase